MFGKVLIANRGEIAVRIIKACQELGVRSVTIYSDVDLNAPHVHLADEAYPLGDPKPSESYLNIDKILDIARNCGAEAIHPGYGFLSENAEFARRCEEEGLAFIGPPSEVIRSMGSKIEAKTIMENAGVPVIPGYHSPEQDTETLLNAADEIGFPLMVKASAGGGGKGMRIVQRMEDLRDAIESARREALGSFGDDTLFLERYLPDPRHIEFQILADNYGKVIHLYERECSIQRRHQKIIEETPSVVLTDELRDRMGRCAVTAAEAVGYRNAGTVEFMYQDGDFYFLEMNTRLQVEHGITEEVTGIDIVKWQLRIASGERLTLEQDQIVQRGHAIECRIYAEDPKEFLPSSGVLQKFNVPHGVKVRHDLGVEAGVEVSSYYDPMIAKLIVHGEDRDDAIRKMLWALNNYIAIGVKTNIPFLRAVLNHEAFWDGGTTTRFIEKYLSDWSPPMEPPLAVLVAAVIDDLSTSTDVRSTSMEIDPYSPWKTLGRWRLVGA